MEANGKINIRTKEIRTKEVLDLQACEQLEKAIFFSFLFFHGLKFPS